jgi:hypothetical protein
VASASGTVTGIAANQARLAAVAEDVKHMDDTHRAIAELVLPAAQAGVPNTTGRGTGALAASLTAHGDATRGWLEHSTEYGTLIEMRFGFVSAATAEQTESMLARYDQGLSEIVERHP